MRRFELVVPGKIVLVSHPDVGRFWLLPDCRLMRLDYTVVDSQQAGNSIPFDDRWEKLSAVTLPYVGE